MKEATIGFIGFGLIGGSLARVFRKLNSNNTIIAYNYNKNKVMGKGLAEALEDHVLDYVYHDLKEGFPSCDIIFLCAPVLSNITYLKELKNLIKPNCILTDVGSVKGNIHAAVDELGLKEQFVGGHPMAGSEKTGYHNSHEKLLENAYYILTPTDETKPQYTQALYELVEETGAIPLILNYNEHDDITAAISHVPHIIAASLVNMVKDSDDTDEKMRTLAAGGFKDITRISSSSPVMWQNICLTNTASIKSFLDKYISTLQNVSDCLACKDEDFLSRFFEEAKEYRNSIPNNSIGMMKKVFELYVDIIDEAGAIATLAVLLAKNEISIKNIGIIHNREFEDGVLRIEFYEGTATKKAVDLLKTYSYTVYER
jgi:prephenate dehydrogenase